MFQETKMDKETAYFMWWKLYGILHDENGKPKEDMPNHLWETFYYFGSLEK
jgi:hypothetical protein